jgi:di/tricarboxylate transporter
LIAIAFWLSGGFIKSGLGNRIAYGIVSLFGKTTLGLTYSLVFAEALLAPAIPSVAARAGDWLATIAQSSALLALQRFLSNLQQDAFSLSVFMCQAQLVIPHTNIWSWSKRSLVPLFTAVVPLRRSRL